MELVYKNQDYVLLSSLIEMYPKVYKGCKTKKHFLEKYDPPKTSYFYCRNVNNEYIITDGTSYKYDKLYISQKWFDKTFNGSDKINNNDIVMAPEIIELDDEEKFRDNDNNIVEIEVRGTRDFDDCYFRVKDIADGFEIENLHAILIHKDKGYDENIHYKYFYFDNTIVGQKSKTKKLYLTYTGVLKVLFGSHKKTSDKFVKWASKTLFTVHLGTQKQKQKLATKLIGAKTEHVKDVINRSSIPISCIYLFSLGYVKNLRNTLNISNEYHDDLLVMKYGMTCDLSRRTSEHEKTYGKLNGVQLELIYYSIIDNEYTSEAEAKLHNLFKLMKNKLFHDKFVELIILDKTELPSIKKEYNLLNETYCNKLSKVNDLVVIERNKNNCLKKDMKHQKTKYTAVIELLKKDMKIQQLEYENQINKLTKKSQ